VLAEEVSVPGLGDQKRASQRYQSRRHRELFIVHVRASSVEIGAHA
jgi:hypothetical protein